MRLTKAQANARLSTITTAEELRKLIRELDTKGSGTNTLLWSGYAGSYGEEGLHSGDISASLRKGDSSLRTIATTEAARFLNLDQSSRDYNSDLDKKLKTIFENDKDGITDFLYGPVAGKPPKRTGKGVWDDVSANFVRQARGDVRLVVGGAGLDKVFAQTEIHELLKNPAVKSIEGVPIEGLKDLAKSSGMGKVLQLLMGLSEANTAMIKIQVGSTGWPIQAPDGTYRLDATDYMKMNTLGTSLPAGMRTVMEFIPEERLLRHAQAVEEIFAMYPILRGRNYALPIDLDPFKSHTAIARLSTYAGRVADVSSMVTMLSEAGIKLHQGDHRGAHDTVTSWVVENAGAVAAGRLATLLVAPLMATGPLGMIIGAGIIIGASTGGADLAKKLHKTVRDFFERIIDTMSPLVLDLDGNGLHTLPLRGHVIHFDHDSNGFAEQTGWVGPDDGLLILDLNRNGQVDNGRELFGNNTRLGTGEMAPNGFLALAMYDSNRDGRIDSRDSIWKQLRVWRDRNSNARSDPGELLTLESANVRTLFLSYTSSNEVDTKGNAHREKGLFQRPNGKFAALTDVWFARDTLNSRQMQLRQVDARTAALPNLPGTGIVPSLHQALMNQEGGALRATFSQWLGAKRLERMNLTETLLFQWCDASNNPFASKDRLIFDIDDPLIQQKVAVIEKLMGQLIPETEELLGPAKVEIVRAANQELVLMVDMILSAQVHLQPLLDLATPMEADGDGHGSVQMHVVEAVEHLRTQFRRDPDPAFIPMIQWLCAHRGPGGLAFFDQLKRIASTQSDSLAVAMRRQTSVSGPWQWMRGGLAAEELTGTNQDDFIEAGQGADTIEAAEGNDSLHGGPGSDIYYGGAGADTYYISQNNLGEFDTIFDDSNPAGQADRVVFWDLNPKDLRLSRDYDALVFSTAQHPVATIYGQATASRRIDEFQFADGVIWDLNTLLLNLPVQGTSQDDRLNGFPDTANRLQGLSGHDSLIGGALTDHLEGQQGNDWLSGSAGRDILDGGEGNDTLSGGEGGDRYIFAANGGHDRLLDSDPSAVETDVVVFNNLGTAALSRVQRIGSDLQLHFGSSTSLTLVNQLHPLSRIEQFQFANGPTWDHATLLQRVS